MNRDFSAALGSSCVYPCELAQVYATFNRLGVKKPTYFIRKIEDRFGRTLEDHTAFDDPWASLTDRVAGGYARLYEPGRAGDRPRRPAFIITDLLRGRGAARAPALRPSASASPRPGRPAPPTTRSTPGSPASPGTS